MNIGGKKQFIWEYFLVCTGVLLLSGCSLTDKVRATSEPVYFDWNPDETRPDDLIENALGIALVSLGPHRLQKL